MKNKNIKFFSVETRAKMSKASKGKIVSEETRKKMSSSHIGMNQSKESIIKIKKARAKQIMKKGRICSKEIREKIGLGNKGKKISEETRKKISNSMKGDKTHLWKGGITEENDIIRTSMEYKAWRVSIFERDGFKCQMPGCDNQERYLEAHHIYKFSDYKELRFDINNGITLCKKCHNKTKRREKKFIDLFKGIIKLKI